MSRRSTIIQKIKSMRSSKKQENFEETFFEVKKRNSLEEDIKSSNLLNGDSSPTPSLNSVGSVSSVNILDFCVRIK